MSVPNLTRKQRNWLVLIVLAVLAALMYAAIIAKIANNGF
jgi:hypothetical protein